MKKYCMIALTIVLALSITACGRRNDTAETEMTILPTMDPTINTNIPDPDVDPKMPVYTDGTNATDGTESTIGATDAGNQTRSGF